MKMQESKIINCLAITLTCSVCFQRISTALGNVFFILTILFFCLILYQRKKAAEKLLKINTEAKGYYKAFGILLLTLLPSAFFSGAPLEGMQNILNLWIYRWIPFFAIPFCVRERRDLMKMMIAFMMSIALDSLMAGYQSYFLNMYRPNGFEGAPLMLAALLCCCIPILTILVLDKRFEGWTSKCALVILLCCFIGLIVGNSRGAWLTIGIILPLMSWTYIKNNTRYICIAGLICCLIGGVFAWNPMYQKRLVSITNITTDRSNADRILVWHSAVNMIEDHPVTGVGPRNFKPIYDAQYKLPQVTQNMLHSHNIFIQQTVEYGLIGLGGFLYFFFYLLKRNYARIKRNDPYARMQIGSILGLLVFGMIDCTLNFSVIVRSFSFLLAILIVLSILFERENKTE